MKEFERPSILAVGMPEMFGLLAALGTDSLAICRDSALGKHAPADSVREKLLGQDNADAGLLQWMIYSSSKHPCPAEVDFSKRSSSTSEQNRTNQAAVSNSLDDSACGIDLEADRSTFNSGDNALVHDQNHSLRNARFENPDSGASGSAEISLIHAGTAKRAIELLRALRFDLLLTSDELPDMAMSQFIGRIRSVRPWQKWALVTSSISPQSEIIARSLGTAAVFDAPADLEMICDLAHAVTARAPARRAVGAAIDIAGDSRPAPSSPRRQTASLRSPSPSLDNKSKSLHSRRLERS